MTRQSPENIYLQNCRDQGIEPDRTFMRQIQTKQQDVMLHNLTKQDFKPIAFTIPKLGKVVKVQMRNVQFQCEDLIYFLANTKTLQQLALSSCDLVFQPKILEDIFTAMPQQLTQLSMINCKLTDNALKALGSVLKDNKVVVLELQQNNFRTLKPLLNALVQKKRLRLNLSNCNIPANQGQVLGEFAAAHKQNIAQLICSGNKFSDQNIKIEPSARDNDLQSSQLPPVPEKIQPQPIPLTQYQQTPKTTHTSNRLSPGNLQLQRQSADDQPLREYQLLDINEFIGDFNELRSQVLQKGDTITSTDLQIAQQIVISLILKLQDFNNSIVQTFKSNYLQYQKLQKLADIKQFKLQQAYEQNIFKEQRQNIQKVHELNDQMRQFQNTYLSAPRKQLHNDQVEMLQLQGEIKELKKECGTLRARHQKLQEQISELESNMDSSDNRQKQAIYRSITQNRGVQQENGKEWRQTFKQQLSQNIQRLLRQIAENKAILGELMSIYEESLQLDNELESQLAI